MNIFEYRQDKKIRFLVEERNILRLSASRGKNPRENGCETREEGRRETC